MWGLSHPDPSTKTGDLMDTSVPGQEEQMASAS